MMSLEDVARDEVDLLVDAALSRITTVPQVQAAGHCLNPACRAPFDDAARRWCDAACRNDWERRQRRH